ncbi:Chitinase 1 [Entomortierella chlamydospora]|uniref:chitinase n=1 Tax=Entomortierella chlamydospora TaxID=101097 RepID=A0A9P6SX55_9FUNG|nr:Chitinase 1 [Entomortierella chlamydospora]KAG0009163.1 Chitinase 1 [Entomortierella chlamydospora]
MLSRTRTALCAIFGLALVSRSVSAFNPLSSTNVVNYWGQNSVYATGGNESSLAVYCQDSTVDAFAIAFVSQIVNGEPILNLSDHCGNTFDGSSLLDCPQVGADIKTCQAKGKALVISIGGASGSYALETADAGTAFAEKIWDTFLGGDSPTRPFGDAVLDGVDLDLEAGTNLGYVAFIQTLRAKFASSSKKFYITAAPQCPYPDFATKAALNAAWFDLVWVQFYNNYCGTQSYGTSNFNFDQWNDWATTVSLNPDVRILLGVPGGPGGASTGIVGSSQLLTILAGVKSYSNFGGVMMWDAGIAAQSGLAAAAANYLHSLPSGGSTTTTTKTTASASATTTTTTKTTTKTTTTTTTAAATTTASPTTTQSGGSCSAAAWNSATAYSGGAVVSYNGHTYTAQWWTQGNVPSSGAPWTDNGACSGTATSTSSGASPSATPGCSGVSAWSSSTAYNSGAKVTYNGYVYTAQWWTQGDTPGSNSVWVQGSACSSAKSASALPRNGKRRLNSVGKIVNKRR